MIVENCKHCGGTHIGEYTCPFERQEQETAGEAPQSCLSPPETPVSATPISEDRAATPLPGVTPAVGGSEGDPASQEVGLLPVSWDDTLLDIKMEMIYAANETNLNNLYDRMTKIRVLAQYIRQKIAAELWERGAHAPRTEQGSSQPKRRTTDDLLSDLT